MRGQSDPCGTRRERCASRAATPAGSQRARARRARASVIAYADEVEVVAPRERLQQVQRRPRRHRCVRRAATCASNATRSRASVTAACRASDLERFVLDLLDERGETALGDAGAQADEQEHAHRQRAAAAAPAMNPISTRWNRSVCSAPR